MSVRKQNLIRTFSSSYRPQTKLLKGNVFTPVCDSVHRRRRCTPPRQTPPGRHPSLGRHPPRQAHPLVRHPLLRQTPARQTPYPQADIPPHPPRQALQQTVRILLECIFVVITGLRVAFINFTRCFVIVFKQEKLFS